MRVVVVRSVAVRVRVCDTPLYKYDASLPVSHVFIPNLVGPDLYDSDSDSDSDSDQEPDAAPVTGKEGGRHTRRGRVQSNTTTVAEEGGGGAALAAAVPV